ncbi:MAG: universal stress protein UspA [Candidatus Muproteobacteria bacterium RIFCSPLOWO2_01_FULL_60_18]|uniref:Universal stress protein UspA n=1 Tax=Candidatus Muproteobacteria bacterium RIFCSPLOWO2_01_FULL_60_18 TaxID=1817768 RepID=A0A1F6TXB6_9PROT|nr:MAG: universal stress protein UspA [Candidatus Muproteobacteria bacterium RIFCSPHIGHO2_01_60_12]OGI49760.1 MAG: universal stress protein UspA [Candidatus Muproteobacteria bacterium RIFCSPLOWO2_01_FULL_60_18]
MNTQAPLAVPPTDKTAPYRRILVALDSSDHANRGLDSAVALAGLTSSSTVTGVHVYAAALHDRRFRQMEGGLPEKYREEQELERQRDVHDDLITRGLSIITDSYLDQGERHCREAGIPFARRSLEGKNYRELAREANGGDYDLLVLGALGLGAVEGSRLGSVCQRVVRRAEIDTLIIKDPARSIAEGPIVVAVDGSPKAYGALVTALALARHWAVPVHVIAVFDPYFHYVAFNRIAGVLSEEAGKVFRFQDQEKLHEEIIDSGLARIYRGHLAVAEAIAREHGAAIATALLDGKPHDAIAKYVHAHKPSLLLLGKTGIHADDELDIGSNTEALLSEVPCALLLTQREHVPEVDVVADVTTSWTHEAERAMENVPGFVRPMARMAILRYAQEHGHTVITEKIVHEATDSLCPSHARRALAEVVEAHDATTPTWSSEAATLLKAIADPAVRENIGRRAEKKARVEKCAVVGAEHVTPFLATAQTKDHAVPAWTLEALARLERVPAGFMRDASREHVEAYAREQTASEITLAVAEAGLARARTTMEVTMKPAAGRCPFHEKSGSASATELVMAESAGGSELLDSDPGFSAGFSESGTPIWNEGATKILERIPNGMSRTMTRKAVEAIAARQGRTTIDGEFLGNILATFQAGSEQAQDTLPWSAAARERIHRAPPMIRGMLVREIEAWARREGRNDVDEDAVRNVKRQWEQRGVFHLDPADPRSKDSGGKT